MRDVHENALHFVSGSSVLMTAEKVGVGRFAMVMGNCIALFVRLAFLCFLHHTYVRYENFRLKPNFLNSDYVHFYAHLLRTGPRIFPATTPTQPD